MLSTTPFHDDNLVCDALHDVLHDMGGLSWTAKKCRGGLSWSEGVVDCSQGVVECFGFTDVMVLQSHFLELHSRAFC